MNAVQGLDVFLLVAALRTRDEGEPHLLVLLDGGHELADAGGVGRDGLLAKDVLARVDGGLDVLGPGVRQGALDENIDVRLEDALVGVPASEALVIRQIDASLDLARSAQLPVHLFPALDLVREEVGKCDQRDVGVTLEYLPGRARAPVTTAEQTNLQIVAAGGFRAALGGRQYGEAGGTARFGEVTARHFFFGIIRFRFHFTSSRFVARRARHCPLFIEVLSGTM